jgi:hypothetical protein
MYVFILTEIWLGYILGIFSQTRLVTLIAVSQHWNVTEPSNRCQEV